MVQRQGAGLQYTACCVADPAARVVTTPSRAHRSPTTTTETVTMDIPRYALLAASALLGFMLLGEWTRYSADHNTAQRLQVPMVDAAAAIIETPLAPLQDDTSAVGVLDPDLPASLDVNLSTPAPLTLADNDQPSRFVSVHTDVLEIMIDLQGGDVVGAGFKDFPKTLADT